MLPQIDKKKKLYFFLILFIFLTTINNVNFITKTNSFFNVNKISIHGLNDNLNQILKKKIKFIINEKIYLINKNNLDQIIKNFNFINKFTVKKIFPSEIKITINQSKLIASTIKEGKNYYIGSNGKLIEKQLFNTEEPLPYVFGDFSNEKFKIILKKIKSVGIDHKSFDSYYYYKNGRWDLKLKNDKIIKLPRENLEEALFKAKILLESEETKHYKIIDLRIPNQVILNND